MHWAWLHPQSMLHSLGHMLAPAPMVIRENTAPVTAAMEAPLMSGLVRPRLSLQKRSRQVQGQWVGRQAGKRAASSSDWAGTVLQG
jgi:hypothetical protein